MRHYTYEINHGFDVVTHGIRDTLVIVLSDLMNRSRRLVLNTKQLTIVVHVVVVIRKITRAQMRRVLPLMMVVAHGLRLMVAHQRRRSLVVP